MALYDPMTINLSASDRTFRIPWTAGQAIGIVSGAINGNWEIEMLSNGTWVEIGARFNSNNRYRSIPVSATGTYRIDGGSASTGVLEIHRQNM